MGKAATIAAASALCMCSCSLGPADSSQDRDAVLAVNKMLVADGCSSCHAVEYARVGPSFADIASVYSATRDVDKDAARRNIIAGSRGKWGTTVMPAQPHITEGQSHEIFNLILSLEKSAAR